MIECPQRDYAVVPAPWPMQWDTTWPIPAPEVIAGALAAPLKGLWVDHIPTRAEIAALNLGLRRDARIAWTNPLVTGDWKSFDRPWAAGHPERMSPQRVMPDAWFDHGEARCAPHRRNGRGVSSGPVASFGLSLTVKALALRLATGLNQLVPLGRPSPLRKPPSTRTSSEFALPLVRVLLLFGLAGPSERLECLDMVAEREKQLPQDSFAMPHALGHRALETADRSTTTIRVSGRSGEATALASGFRRYVFASLAPD